MESQNKILSQVNCQIYKTLFSFLMTTGCRPSEGRGLRWENINFKNDIVKITSAMDGEIYRETTKTKRVRNIPLFPEVVELLRELPNRGISGFVFVKNGKPLNNKAMFKMWNKACKLAGIDISLYQGTKHSLACQYINLPNAKSEILQKQLGHSSLKTTQRYAKLMDESLLDIFRVRTASVDVKIANN